MRWRSAWRRLPLSVLFISPSSLSACRCGCFLSLVVAVGLIGVVGLLIGVVEIRVAAWRAGDRCGGTVEVEIGKVGLGGFRWGFFVVVVACVWVCGDQRGKGVFLCGCCGLCLGMVVVWFLGLVVAWWPVSCGCGWGVWLVFLRWFYGFCGRRWWWVSCGKCGGDGFVCDGSGGFFVADVVVKGFFVVVMAGLLW